MSGSRPVDHVCGAGWLFSRCWSHMTAVKQHCIRLLNGDTVARPGPRLAEALEATAKALYPDLLP